MAGRVGERLRSTA